VRLMELLSALPGAEPGLVHADPEIRRVVADSRRVSPGDLFVALRGEKADGLDFVPEALARGAAAIVAGHAPASPVSIPWVLTAEPRRALGLLAAKREDNPAEKLVLAGVTGTNGKTTTAVLLQSLLASRFGGAGFVGTIGYRIGRREIPADRTTPDAALLQELLGQMVREGIRAAAMEVSSHALALDRVEGCRFDLTVFTNLTRDHLDFHRDMESYYGAKRRLFDRRKPGAAAVLNAADSYGRRLAAEVREERALRERRQAHAQASFSTTCQLGLRRPTRGNPWRIESTDFVVRTRSRRAATALRDVPARSSKTPSR